MGEVKQAHKVPRFYLERFAGQDGHVWNYDKSDGRRWQTKPENTAKQGNFYAVTKEDGTKDLTIEGYLSVVESKAEAGYSILLDGGIPQGQVRADFATFIAVQFMRTQTMRQFWAESYAYEMQKQVNAAAADKKTFDEFMTERARETGEVVTEEKKEEIRLGILNPSNFIIKVPQEMTLSALLPADEMMEAICGMTWTIGRATNSFFITGDNPVVANAPEQHIKSTAKPRLICFDKGSLVDFPLSPELILVMTWKKMRENIAVTRKRVLYANRERAIRANRFIYSHVNDEGLGRLAAKYNGAKWGIREEEDGNIQKSKVEVDRL